MTRPTVSTRTDLFYLRLPQMYRDADPAQDWALLRFLSLLVDQYSEQVGDLVDRFTTTGDLADPALADPEWLPWLARLAGVNPDLYTTTDQLRVAISGANANRAVGSTEGILAPIRPVLTGSRTARIVNRDPTHFTYTVRTFEKETPDPSAVAALLKATKPAGLVALFDVSPGESFGDLAQRGLTFGDLNQYTNNDIRVAVPGQPIGGN